MFGASEPRLRPLPEAAAARLAEIRGRIDAGRPRDDLARLPGPRNRLHAAEAMERTDRMLLECFREAGWEAELRPFEERDVWAYVDHDDFMRRVHHERLADANVVARKEGESSDALVVVAHHDTVRDTPGADDNGAGVVALLELARVLAPERLRWTVVLAAVDMEELGLFGSHRLVRELSAERPILGALVYETMAYTDPSPGAQLLPPGLGAVYVGQVRRIKGRGSRGDFTALIYQAGGRELVIGFGEALQQVAGRDAAVLLREPTDLPLLGGVLRRTVPFVRNFSRSDHVAFWEAGIPAIWITDTANFRNPNYHRPSDTPETIDLDRLSAIVAASAAVLLDGAGILEG